MRAICICYDVTSHDMLGENYTKSYRRLSHNFAIKPHKSLLNEPSFRGEGNKLRGEGGNPSAPPPLCLNPWRCPIIVTMHIEKVNCNLTTRYTKV